MTYLVFRQRMKLCLQTRMLMVRYSVSTSELTARALWGDR
jgi:hypothetical protein